MIDLLVMIVNATLDNAPNEIWPKPLKIDFKRKCRLLPILPPSSSQSNSADSIIIEAGSEGPLENFSFRQCPMISN